MEINVIVTVPGLPEAINNLAAAIAGKTSSDNRAVTAPAVAPDNATQPAAVAAPVTVPTAPAAPMANPTPAVVPTATSVAPVVQPQPAPAATVPPVTAAPAPVSPMTSPSKSYTIDEISVAGAALCEQGKMPQLIGLLGKYGVQSITQLPTDPAVIANFVVELRGLGANL